MKWTHFVVEGSPLDGLQVPRDWSLMDLAAKRRALVAYGHAADFEGACSVLALHRAAVGRARKARQERWDRAREAMAKRFTE